MSVQLSYPAICSDLITTQLFSAHFGRNGAWWRQSEGKGLYCSLTPKREGRGREGLATLCWEAWVSWGVVPTPC